MDPDEIRRDAESPVTATRGDLEEVVETLSDAFAVEPDMKWFIRDDERRDAARRSLFAQLIHGPGFRHGRIDRPARGGAAAVWMPFEWVRPDPLPRVLLEALAMLPITGLSRAHRLVALRQAMDRQHPMDRTHAYLWFLGVAPAAQGRGVGSALLRHANARHDAAGLPAYLETSTLPNVRLYARHGYRIISERRALKSAPVTWGMWREPAQS